MPTRAVETLLVEPALKAALGDPSKQRLCVDLGRLLAAFYLDFPMLAALEATAGEVEVRAPLPSLFAWASLERTNQAQTLERERLARLIPSCYGYRLPVLLLARNSCPLEAILYVDHFNDIRSSLVLRLFADHHYGLSLSAPFFRDFVDRLLDTISNGVDGRERLDLRRRIEVAKRNIDGLLELDVALGSDLLPLLETSLVERMEMLYAALPPLVEDVALLPRPPLYSTPDASHNDLESSTWELMHVFVQAFLESQHRSCRLQAAVDTLLAEFAEFNFITQFSSGQKSSSSSGVSERRECSLLTRLTLVILRSIYRDRLSLAVKQNKNEADDVARLYRALLDEDDDNNELQYFERWFRLAQHDDIRNLVVFIEQLREGYVSSTLPPLHGATRDQWSTHLLAERSLAPPRDDDCIWARQLMPDPPQVNAGFYRQLAFVCTAWSGLWLRDESLIAIRVGVRVADLVRTAYEFPFETLARTPSNGAALALAPAPSRPFNIDQERPSTSMTAPGPTRPVPRPRRPRSTNIFTEELRDRLRDFSFSQRSLVREVEAEREFLQGKRKPVRTAHIKPESSSSDSPRLQWKNPQKERKARKNERKRIEAIVHEDLAKLEKKLEKLSEYLRASSSSSGLSSESVIDSQRTEKETFEEKMVEDEVEDDVGSSNMDLLEDNPPAVLISSPDEEVRAPALFEIERLDFRSLTPPPKVNPGIPRSLIAQGENDAPTKIEPPEWMRLLPLNNSQSFRPLTLPPRSAPSRVKTTTQVSVGTQMDDLADSGFMSLKRVGFVRPLSQEEIQQVLLGK